MLNKSINNLSPTFESIKEANDLGNPTPINRNFQYISPILSVLELLPSKVQSRSIKATSDRKKFKAAIAENDNQKVKELLESGRYGINSKDKAGNTAYHLAVLANNLDAIQILQENHANINQKNNLGYNPLIVALINNSDLIVIDLLIKNGVNINETDNNGYTAIHYAVNLGNVSLIEHLIKYNFNLNVTDHSGCTLLQYAIQNSKKNEIIEILIKYCLDINEKDTDGRTAIHYALSVNNIFIVNSLIKQGADINAEDINRQTVIHYATKAENSPEIIKFLVDNGANINAQDNSGSTALHLAASSTYNKDLLSSLVSSGIGINMVNNSDYGAIYNAIQAKNIEAISFLLTTDVNIFEETYENKLYYQSILKIIDEDMFLVGTISSEKQKIYINIFREIVSKIALAFKETLVKSNAFIVHQVLKFNLNTVLNWFCNFYYPVYMDIDLNTLDRQGWAPIHAALGGANVEAATILINNGTDINVQDKNDRTILHYAADMGFEAGFFKLLFDKQISVNVKDKDGYTAIYYAIKREDNLKAVPKLLLHNSNIFISNTDKQHDPYLLEMLLTKLENKLNDTNIDSIVNNILKALVKTWNNNDKGLLHYVSELGHLKILNKLIELSSGNFLNIDFNKKDQDGNTAIHCAASKKQDEIMKILIKHVPAALIETNNNKETVLHKAVKVINNKKVVALLLDFGASVAIKDKNQYTPFYHAIKMGDTNIIDFLIKNGPIDVNSADECGSTPLHFATNNSNLEVMKVLLANGADIDKQNNQGLTSFHLAISNKFIPGIQFLRNKGVNLAITDNKGNNHLEKLAALI